MAGDVLSILMSIRPKIRISLILVIALVLTGLIASVLGPVLTMSRMLELEAREVGEMFDGGSGFTEAAKRVLETRRDIAYLKLLGEDGKTMGSVGEITSKGVEEFSIRMSDFRGSLIVGLREPRAGKLILYSLIWGGAVAVFFSTLFVFVLVFLHEAQARPIEKLISALKRTARGDFDAKLGLDEGVVGDPQMMRLFEGFNQMIEQLKRRGEAKDSKFEPVVVFEKKEEKLRQVTAVVARVSDFEKISSTLEPSELSSFLTDYRKSASDIISNYGGTIEALLQEEIVALFNVPYEQDKPELRAVCASVEILQMLANIGKKRSDEGKKAIGGKVGIGSKGIFFHVDAEIPEGVKDVISIARNICKSAPLWKVLVSEDTYAAVRGYVEAKEIKTKNGASFSIVSVEEGVV